jgi:hypothetical protein
MDSGLVKLCSKISLSEREKVEISVSEGEVAEVREIGGRCLIGKIGPEKQVNREAFQSVMSRLWRMAGTVVFKEVSDNIWIFEFTEEEYKKRVMEGRPWSFDRQILVLNEFDGQCLPAKMEFITSPFWIQVHDMPLICMTKGVGKKIGDSLGVLEDIDIAGDGAGWGRCLRIRVSIDLSRPLERGRMMNVGGQSYWVIFKYEKLPLFCFRCGCVIHGIKGCPVSNQKRMSGGEEGKEWGVWLRAEKPMRQDQFRQGSRGGAFFSDKQAAPDWRRQSARQNQKVSSDSHGIPTHSNHSTNSVSSGESDKSQSRGEDHIVQNLKFAMVEDRGGVFSKNMEGQNWKEKCVMSGNLNAYAAVGKSPDGCVLRDKVVKNSKLALVEDISGGVVENMEGQKIINEGVLRGNLKNHVVVGKRPDVFVLRDEASETESFMSGGDYLKSNVANNIGVGEGQEVLANLANELTRMDVGVELDEVGHVGEKLQSMGGVMLSKSGVEGAVSDGSNMKQWKRTARKPFRGSVGMFQTNVLGIKRKEKSGGGGKVKVGKKREENNNGQQESSSSKILAVADFQPRQLQ